MQKASSRVRANALGWPKNTQGGLVRLIIIILVIIVILSLFRVNLKGYIDDHVTLKDNFVLIGYIGVVIWEDYIVRPAVWVWEHWLEPLLKGEVFSGLKSKLEERRAQEESL